LIVAHGLYGLVHPDVKKQVAVPAHASDGCAGPWGVPWHGCQWWMTKRAGCCCCWVGVLFY